MVKLKSLFNGDFSYREKAYPGMKCHAYTERQAWFIFCRRLAKLHDVHVDYVLSLFDGSRDNFKITKEMEFREG